MTSISLRTLLPAARAQAAASGRCLVTELLLLAQCDGAALVQASEAELGVRYFTLAALTLQPAAPGVLAFTDCIKRAVYPLAGAGAATFVVADPWDAELLQWLANLLGRYPTLAWAARGDIVAALERAQEHVSTSSQLTGTPPAYDAGSGDGAKMISIETIERSSSPVVRFVDSAIYDAWRAGASDIHFECGREGVRVKLRLDGVLVPASDLGGRQLAEEVISRIKVLAQLDIAERRIPQDGRFSTAIGGRELDFRVSVMPSIFGEDAVVRLLDKTQLRGEASDISLASLGLDGEAIARIRQLARRPHGMLLVTGPTGSGKTTTLYAALSEIQTGQEKIITIEDPVEYELPGILQIPVNDKKGLTFSQGLRSILRHDPDKILVGEIRDPETAEIAVQAALTGHLVFTTVHANSIFDVIGRFVHMHIDLYSLMSALNGVVAQRLIRCICPHCSYAEPLTAELRDRFEALGLATLPMSTNRGRGCDHCRHTGYKGRAAIAEVLSLDDALRSLILARASAIEVKAHARASGARPLALRALDLVAAGRTTLDEVDRVVAHD